MAASGAICKAAVVGGSIAGLCAALGLRRIGCAVDVYERTPGAMSGRGAGIVAQPDLMRLLPDLPAVACGRRRHLLGDGDDGLVVEAPLDVTSWDAIHRTLRAALPARHYHAGAAVTAFAQSGGRVRLRLADGGEVAADLLVCADGSRSAARRRLLPGLMARYAGYIAWRGTLDEGRLPRELVAFFDGSFTLAEARTAGHILCYLIPGAGAAIAPGRRRLNWVWYVSLPPGGDLDRLLTDRDGRRRDGSVPAGWVPDGIVAELHALALRELPPRFRDLVQRTPDPFIQVIADLSVPRMAFGRVCLLGDAAFVLRPHAAAATAKAAADAAALAEALARMPGDIETALLGWERRQLVTGQELVERGVRLGELTVGPPGRRMAGSPQQMLDRFAGVARPWQAR